MQHFCGDIEGFYVGEPDSAGFGRTSAKAKHFKLRIYRAVVRRVQLLETPASPVAPTPVAPTPVAPAPVALEPGCFRQETLRDARLTPVTTRAGWFEGPIHDLQVSEFRSTHQKQQSGRIYGRFVGRVSAHFELPPPPLPPRAEALLAELSAAEPELATAAEPVAKAEPATKPGAGVAQPLAGKATDTAAAAAPEDELEGSPATPQAPGRKQPPSQVPLLLLVAVGAISTFALCGPSRALIWLVFLLPTLLLRRILRGALDESTGTRAFGAISMFGQLACLGFLGVAWWASGCKDLAPLPVAGLVLGVFVTAVLPPNLPLLVNGAVLGIVLGGWCSALGKRCEEPKPKPAMESRPTANDPGVPRTNADGSWPRHPPRALPQGSEPKKP
jgi:hypothetical protein